MDKQYKVLFRSPSYAYTEQSQKWEQEANNCGLYFMHQVLLNKEIEKMQLDQPIEDDQAISKNI